MGQNEFAQSLVEVMLSWMRWLTSWFWNILNSGGTSGGFLAWFSDNWKSLAVFLIVIGIVVDWVVWMIRWRPYWLWLRKRQIIYEEVPVAKKKKPAAQEEEYFPAAADEQPASDDSAEYEDIFIPSAEETASPTETPSQVEEVSVPNTEEDDLSEWDSDDDPYSQTDPSVADTSTASGETPKKVNLNHMRPVLGERMELSDVDDGQ